MTIPKTERGLSNRITKIRSQLSAFKREYGFIDDGGGIRYFLFYLYFLLGDNRRSSEFIRWYEKEFPDDIGEPIQILCWALILHRMGKNKDAEYRLADTMLSNIYLIPYLLGNPVKKAEMWHSSNYEDPDIIDYLPDQIKNAIAADDLEWILELYNSDKFQKVLNRHITINHELESIPIGDARSKLVKENFNLLDVFR